MKNEKNKTIFSIYMNFIFAPRGLHENKMFDIEGNSISFKWEKKFLISLKYFVRYWRLNDPQQEK